MSEVKYCVVLTNIFNKKFNKEDVIENLSKLFKLDLIKATDLFDSTPRIIKSGISLDQCKSYSKIIYDKTGLKTEFELDLNHDDLVSSLVTLDTCNHIEEQVENESKSDAPHKILELKTGKLFPKLFSLKYREEFTNTKFITHGSVYSNKIFVSFIFSFFLTLLFLMGTYSKLLIYISSITNNVLLSTIMGLIFFFLSLVILPFLLSAKREFLIEYTYNKENFNYKLVQKNKIKSDFNVYDSYNKEVINIKKNKIFNSYLLKDKDGDLIYICNKESNFDDDIISTASEIRDEIIDFEYIGLINDLLDKFKVFFVKSKKEDDEDKGDKILIKNKSKKVIAYVSKGDLCRLYVLKDLVDKDDISYLITLFIIISGY